MIELPLFIVGSLIIYITVFYVMVKLPLHEVFKILIVGLFFTGTYLNISENGSLVKKLNIVYTDEISIVSMVFVLAYLITGVILFKNDN